MTSDSSPARAGTPGAGWTAIQIRVLVTLLLVITSNYVDRSLLGIIQEPVKHDLKLTDWQLGLVGGPSFAIFYALAGIPSARWAERANRAHVLPIILSIWSTMTAFCGAAQNFAMLALARAGVGLGEGGCIPICHSLVSEYFGPKQRGMALSILASASAIGGFIAASAGSVIAQTWSWRVACFAVGAPGLLLALVVRFTIRDPRSESGRAEPPRNLLADLRVLRRSRSFLLILAANAFSSCGNSGVLLFTSSYFLRTYHLTLVQVGAIYATGIGVAGLAGSLLSGFLADRFAGPRGRSYVFVPAIGTGLACILFATAFTRPEWTVAVACLIPAYMMQDMKAPSLAAVQTISPPHMRATSAAVLYLAITFAGTGLGGPIAGAVSDFVASHMLPAAWGHLAQVCPGGRAAAGASAVVVGACQHASAAGVRAGLLASAGFTACASLLFFVASKVIDLKTDGGREPA